MEKKVYFCIGPDESTAFQGDTLEAAHEAYCEQEGDAAVKDCEFFQAIPIKVESKILVVETLVRSK